MPKGLYRTVEDNDKEIEENTPNEGALVMPSTPDMSSAAVWVHHTQNILMCNRLTHIEPTDVEDPAEVMKKIEGGDPYEKRLKPINLDSKVKGGLPAWIVKFHGDKTMFASGNAASGKVNYGVVVVKSMLWPGSFSFYSQGRCTQIYVGDGLKYEDQTFYPIYPPVIRDDPVEKTPYDEVSIPHFYCLAQSQGIHGT